MPLPQPPSVVPHSASFDPQAQPLVAGDRLPPLPVGSLTLDHIRTAFESPIHWQVDALFTRAFSPESDRCLGARRAAVLIPLIERPNGLQVLFTRRSDHLRDHAGQVSFPGGSIEPTDAGVVAAALRETHEEIGVADRYVHVMGTQPALLTTTGFLMTPVVGELLTGFRLQAQDSEVAEIFEVPLEVLMDPAHHELRQLRTQWGHGRYFYAIPWQGHFIWGATAVLLRNLYHFLAASFSARMR